MDFRVDAREIGENRFDDSPSKMGEFDVGALEKRKQNASIILSASVSDSNEFAEIFLFCSPISYKVHHGRSASGNVKGV